MEQNLPVQTLAHPIVHWFPTGRVTVCSRVTRAWDGRQPLSHVLPGRQLAVIVGGRGELGVGIRQASDVLWHSVPWARPSIRTSRPCVVDAEARRQGTTLSGYKLAKQ